MRLFANGSSGAMLPSSTGCRLRTRVRSSRPALIAEGRNVP
jgi:hypothetical protein